MSVPINLAIQEVMRARGWDYSRLAQEMRVTAKTIRRMEHGKQDFSKSFAKKLCTIPLWNKP